MFFVYAEEMETRNFYEYEKPLWPAELTNFKQKHHTETKPTKKKENEYVIRAEPESLHVSIP